MTQVVEDVSITASGVNIGGTQDEMHFAFIQVTGDIDIRGRLPGLIRTHATQTKAGFMVRESLNANARHAYSFIRSGGYAGLIYRTATGGNSTTVAGPQVVRPAWIRLTRVGNVLTAYCGQDGVSWTQVGQITIAMPTTVYVGMAVTSFVDGSLTTADFDNLSLTGASTGTADTTPPTTPSNLRVTATTPTSVSLAWNASTDSGTGVAGYRVHRSPGNSPIASVASPVHTDTTVAPNTTYSYSVSAFDGAIPANESPQSAALSVTTPPASVITPNVVGLTQSAAQIQITNAGLVVGTISSASSSTVPSGSVISQVPAAGTSTTPGSAVNLVISTGGAADITPPSVPQGLMVSGVTSNSVSLTWSASTDTGGAGLAGYRVFRDGGTTPIATVTTTSFTDNGLAAGTTYTYRVAAFDNASPPNVSAAAGPVTATTLSGTTTPVDTTPPSVPTNLRVTATTSTSVSLAWNASTDSGTGVAGYRIYRNGGASPIATSTTTSFTDGGRTPGTTYTYRVSAIDRATPANESAQSAAVTATTPNATASCSVTIEGGTPVMNVGELASLRAVVTGGSTPVTYQWSVTGPIIKDYDERTAVLWSVTPMSAADYQQQTISFYWKPVESQRHPLNGGPVNRTVSVTVNAGGATCNAQRIFSVERNMTDINRQAEDFYTSNHPDSAGRGRVRNDHSAWHQDWMPFVPNYGATLFDFHREYVDRFNSWRQEFGYPPVTPWDPGTPLPTGPDVDHAFRNATYTLTPLPSWFTLAGGSATRPSNGTACDTQTGQNDLLDFTSRNALGCAINKPMHSDVHNRVGGHMATTVGSPMDPIFWRWHEYMDTVSQNWLAGGGANSAMLPIPMEEQRLAGLDAVAREAAAHNHAHRHHHSASEESEGASTNRPTEQVAPPVLHHHPPAAATAGPNVTLLEEEDPNPVIRRPGKAARGPRIIYESPFRTRPFVTELPSVTVTFSVPVFGITADALTVNGSPATQVTGTGAGPYVFSGFAPPQGEVIQVKFASRTVRDAEGNLAGRRAWRYWVVKAGEDRDYDGLDDAEEVSVYMTNPRLRDTDNDGMPDGFEVKHACLNPFEDERAPHDMSGATLPGDDDADDDGYENLAEYYRGTDPCAP
jgi:chitodextrinase/regulation of enolase protein 1 (concanavalin A-like superfamily)